MIRPPTSPNTARSSLSLFGLIRHRYSLPEEEVVVVEVEVEEEWWRWRLWTGLSERESSMRPDFLDFVWEICIGLVL